MSLGSRVVPKIDLFNGVRRYHCIIWEKIICIICIYLPETYTFIGVRMFPTVHYREFPNVEGIPHCYQGIFFQLLYTNQYFLNNIAQPRFYNTYTQIHLPLKVLFSSLTFVSQTTSPAVSII